MFTFFVYVGTLVPPSSAVSNLAYENPAYEAASESISSPNYLQLNETSTVVHWYNILSIWCKVHAIAKPKYI